MVYNIKKSNGAPLVSIQDSTQDTTTTSLILPGRNSVGYGLAVDQNFVNLLQNFANTSSPPNPLQGQLWFDSINNNLKIYDGSKWIEVSTGFDGSSGITTTRIGPDNTDCTIIVSQYQIVVVISSGRIQRSDCPDSIIFNDISYSFAPRFSKGIYAGINIANDPSGLTEYWMNGTSTYANVLVNARTIFINGVAKGQFRFDASSNVNVTVTDANVYVNNTNVTVGGTWTKVLVSDGGRILAGNNITSSDIVAALGYTPYDGGNINVNAVSNTIVGRDANANFAANVVVCENLVANKSVVTDTLIANTIVGTATNARVLTDSRTIYLDGDVYGNVAFNGGSNVVIETTMVTSGVASGVYNLVNVDDKGRVTNGGYYDMSPFNSVVLFPSDGYIPAGWTECNGGTVVDTTTGTVTVTPNLIAAGQTISAGADIPLKYYIKYLTTPPPSNTINLANGTPGTGPTIYVNGTAVNNPESSVVAVSTSLSGGPVSVSFPAEFLALSNSTTEGELELVQGFQDTNFRDTAYFDAVALVMGLGDNNGIMFSTYDVWNKLETLTVQDIIDNLHLRANAKLPAAAGKYMLPLTVVRQQIENLAIAGDFAFSPIVQDQLMSSVTNKYANQLMLANVPPVDNNLFGCHYFGSAQAFIAVIKSNSSDIVSDVLQNNGFYTSPSSQLSNYTRDKILNIFAQIVAESKTEIQIRRELNQNVITSGQWMNTSNVNVIVTGSTVNGYKIGSSDFVDLQGGYFPEYDLLTTDISTTEASIGPAIQAGSAGSVSMTLEDAGACALAGVLDTDISYDQAGIAQVAINRTGSSVSGTVDFTAKNGFDIATYKDAFKYLSAAIYGANENQSASDLYGDLFINRDFLKSALSIVGKSDFVQALSDLFEGRLSQKQLDRVYALREQIYNNGTEIQQAQSAVQNSLYTVSNTTVASTTVKKPFGDNASGYIISSPLPGFYIPNTTESAASAIAPSPDALLNRLRNNKIKPVSTAPTSNSNIVTDNVSNTVVGGNTTTTGNTVVETPKQNVSNQPDQGSSNYSGGGGGYVIAYNSGIGWWGFSW